MFYADERTRGQQYRRYFNAEASRRRRKKRGGSGRIPRAEFPTELYSVVEEKRLRRSYRGKLSCGRIVSRSVCTQPHCSSRALSRSRPRRGAASTMDPYRTRRDAQRGARSVREEDRSPRCQRQR